MKVNVGGPPCRWFSGVSGLNGLLHTVPEKGLADCMQRTLCYVALFDG